jgi:YVTN family beta-propeller protein
MRLNRISLVFCFLTLIASAAVRAQTVYVVAYSFVWPGIVTVLEAPTNTVLTTTSVGYLPSYIAISRDGSKAYISNYGNNTVMVIATATNSIVATVQVGHGPDGIAITPDGSRAYVANYSDNTVSVIDTATNSVTATVTVGRDPYGVTITPDGKKAYVADVYNAAVSVIDTATNTVKATVNVGAAPYALAASPVGSKVYVANFNSNSVSVIDTSTNTVVSTIAVGASPYGVAITPDGSKACVTNYHDNTVSIIDTATNTVSATCAVGTGPIGVAITPDGSQAFVANSLDGDVSTVDLLTGTAVATTTIGDTPMGIAIGPVEAQPTMTALSPDTVRSQASGIVLTITGTDFVKGAKITIGTDVLTPSSVSPTQATVTIPAGDISVLGTVYVILTDPDGGSAALELNVTSAPTISSLSPASVMEGTSDFTLTVTGSDFQDGAVITFGSDTLSLSDQDATTAVVTIPASDVAAAGTVTVSLINPDGGTASAPFVIKSKPAISSLSPASVVAGSPTFSLTLNGTDFLSGATVGFGTDTLTPASLSATQATVSIPAADVAAVGTVVVTLTNPDGRTATRNFAVKASVLSGISVQPSWAIGGVTACTVTVTLTGKAPVGGFAVTLSSSDTALNGTATIPAGSSSVSMAYSPAATATTVDDILTATAGGVSRSAKLTVDPLLITSLTVSPSRVAGGQSTTGTVTLNTTAQVDTAVSLSSNSGYVAVPASVTVKAGTSSATFAVTTSTVAAYANTMITARSGADQKTAWLGIYKPAVSSVVLSPSSVGGGSSSQGTVTLNTRVTLATTVTLLSTNSATAVPATVTVPAGSASTTFTVTTSKVSRKTYTIIKATAPGGSGTAKLNITP